MAAGARLLEGCVLYLCASDVDKVCTLPSACPAVPLHLNDLIDFSPRCTEVKRAKVKPQDIRNQNRNGVFDRPDPGYRQLVEDLDGLPILDAEGEEIHIYDYRGNRIARRMAVVDDEGPPCGVLVDLTNIHALFNPYMSTDGPEDYSSTTSSDSADLHHVHVNAYPLAFLGSVGNIQANGIPPCFLPSITEINQTVSDRRRNPQVPQSDDRSSRGEDDNAMSVDVGDPTFAPSRRAVKPVSAQFYNYLAHRVATRAGRHDTQQGSVTAAISGAFAKSRRHKQIASGKQDYCQLGLPSERFQNKISLEGSPTSCRAEFVYSVDVRALKDPSGTHVFLPSNPVPFPSLTFSPTGPYSTTSSFLLPDPGRKKESVVRSGSIW
jgi:hypothetical protein